MRTTPRDGYLVDQGAFFLPTTHRALLSLAAEAGIADQIVPGGFVLATARDGLIHELPGDRPVQAILSTKLFSTAAKLELIKLIPEIWRARKASYERMPECGAYDKQTLAEWSQTRFSPELREYLIDTTLRGIFATSSATSPRVDFLAILALLQGAKLVAFRGGMGAYAQHLAQDMDVQLGAEVLSVEEKNNRVAVIWRDHEGVEHVDEAAASIVAVPAAVARRILPGLDAWRREHLKRVRHGKAYVLTVALRQSPRGVNATYIQVPRAANPILTGIMLDHHKAPGRAPQGKGLLSLALLDSWSESQWDADEAQVQSAILQALDSVLPGVSRDMEFTELHRWFQEYNQVGFYRELGPFRALCEQDGRIQLAGDFHSMQNLNAATITGQRAAQRLIGQRYIDKG